MSEELRVALKEWAVVCQALATGRQGLLLRKGGIAEKQGEFVVEHRCFWLYPTWTHQQNEGLQPEAQPLLREVLREENLPPTGMVRISHFAEVTGIYHVKDEVLAQMLAHLHVLSDTTVRQRFHYRQPGLRVLSVRVYRAPAVFELPETAHYQGCRSWVELGQALPTEGATPVLEERAYADLLVQLDALLGPRALV